MESQQEYSARLQKVRKSMSERGLAHLLLYAPGQHNFLRMNYVAYLTDFISLGPHAVLDLPLEDDPVLFLSPAWDIPRAGEKSWVGDVRCLKDLWDHLDSHCGKTGLAGREVISSDFYGEIVNSQNAAPINARDLVEKIARQKSPFEIERLKRGAAIADAGVKALHDEARAGLREFELAAIVEFRMRSLGAEDNFGMVVASHHNQALHPPTDKVVEPGDIIIGEITPCVGGYFVQICRTMILGRPSPVLAEKFAILKKAMELGLKCAEIGAPASAIAAAINRILSDAGYERFCRPPYMRVRGHGLGSGSAAPGNLEEENSTLLEEGMTFIIHPNQYLPETGYLTLGDTVVITKEGARPLTQSSWDLYIKE